ncbi:zinc finger protein, putative [Babesia ovis]|uniref:Zinc finger protein, putative n=1 Tax=Babesia ovis TaxID=5869 RepID=A0A9W5WUY3_BABOV|nr:zinc finger protein, putative [Babesia ovis]
MKKKRRRSDEAAARHRKRYLEIIKRQKRLGSGQETSRESETTSACTSTEGRRPLCKYYYRTGSCVHGSSCNFSHDCIPITSKELKLCRYYLQDPSRCKYTADDCKYSHDPGLFLCRNAVINGVCNNMAYCDFKHLDAASIASLDDAERLKFCYNNKRFLTDLLLRHANRSSPPTDSLDDARSTKARPSDDQMSQLLDIDESYLATLPWYLQYVNTLLIRDHETRENG